MRRLGYICFLLSLPAAAQVDPDKLASGRADHRKWQKTELSLRKAIAKDSANAEARFTLSRYYFHSANPSFNLDSAYRYNQLAARSYRQLPQKEKEKLRKAPLDSNLITQLGRRIDSASFEKAKRLNSIAGYQYFLDKYPNALQRAAATELRDEVAYLEALKTNTWASFRNFMSIYPSSHRTKDARDHYDKLLFEDKTRDRRLTSYRRFLQQFPESPYRTIAEQNIFEIATATGSPPSFRWFITEYPASPLAKRAKDILYGMQRDSEDELFDPAWMNDSLRHAEDLRGEYWVPVYKAGKYGFMDGSGAERIAPRFQSVSEDYRCGDVNDVFLNTSDGLIARNGTVLWSRPVNGAASIGSGFIKVVSDSGIYVIHESGFRLSAVVEDAQVIAGSMMSFRKKGKWSVYTLAGREVMPPVYDQVTAVDSIIVMTRGAKKVLSTPARLGTLVDRAGPGEEMVFDDVRRWGPQQYWVRNGVLEGVLSDKLTFIIPLDRQVLQKTSFGFLQGKEDLKYIRGVRSLENIPYQQVQDQGGWIRLLTANGRHILYDKTLARLNVGDSIWFQGQLAFLRVDDSVKAFLPSGQRLSFLRQSVFYFKEFKDSAAWLVQEDKKNKVVFDAATGIKLFAVEADQLDAVSPVLFLITRQGRKGLITETGKLLLPVEYDAIVAAGRESFSLLKERKFGWYDVRSNFLIKPAYERNIKGYNAHIHTAFREKGYGFITPDGRPLGNFEWEEIQYWNDSTAWVRKNFQWILYQLYQNRVQLDNVRTFSVIADTPLEKIYLVRQENAYGVISNRRGIVVPLQYSDVINLGTREKPLYFTERHIEEAGISVVVYYDSHGKIIRRQAMEAEEFEKVYCDN